MFESNRVSGTVDYVSELKRLTPRQSAVAYLLAEGLSYKEIATKLGISPHTVNTHVKTILKRLHLSGSRRLASIIFGSSVAEDIIAVKAMTQFGVTTASEDDAVSLSDA